MRGFMSLLARAFRAALSVTLNVFQECGCDLIFGWLYFVQFVAADINAAFCWLQWFYADLPSQSELTSADVKQNFSCRKLNPITKWYTFQPNWKNTYSIKPLQKLNVWRRLTTPCATVNSPIPRFISGECTLRIAYICKYAYTS